MNRLCLTLPLIAVFAATSDFAQSPSQTPKREGTVKAAVNVPADLFEKQLALVEQRRAGWLDKAEKAKPELIRTAKKPVSVVTVAKDPAAFQGWKIGSTADVKSVYDRPLKPGDSFILDFGEHLAGYGALTLRGFETPMDAPLRLSLIFGEVLAEVTEPFDPYTGGLARSWLQDETVNIDVVPQTVRLPRRYAFRYLKVTVVSCSANGKAGFSEIAAEAVSSADEKQLAPFTPRNDGDAALDRVARATLRDCMQTVFEDGPKRDRRLWLGDTRLQAIANYATYRNYGLVKRSLYVLAGTASDKGLVATCAFEKPQPVRGGDSILDYTALFAPTVLEYLEASGDRETAEDLWPLVVKQLDFTLETVNEEGLLTNTGSWWCFVDWHDLDKQASEHAIVLFGLKATQRLAEKLGKTGEVAFIPDAVARMENAARKHLWDDAQGFFVSGPKREISWASQAWMTLAGVPSPEQAKRAMLGVIQHPTAQKPGTPYLYHYVIEALQTAGLRDDADRLMRDYWGGMVKKGADTFWEAYDPTNDHLSPYGSHLMNSYCHAWSCTPTYLLRKK